MEIDYTGDDFVKTITNRYWMKMVKMIRVTYLRNGG